MSTNYLSDLEMIVHSNGIVTPNLICLGTEGDKNCRTLTFNFKNIITDLTPYAVVLTKTIYSESDVSTTSEQIGSVNFGLTYINYVIDDLTVGERLIIYTLALVDENQDICWSSQPFRGYINIYEAIGSDAEPTILEEPLNEYVNKYDLWLNPDGKLSNRTLSLNKSFVDKDKNVWRIQLPSCFENFGNFACEIWMNNEQYIVEHNTLNGNVFLLPLFSAGNIPKQIKLRFYNESANPEIVWYGIVNTIDIRFVDTTIPAEITIDVSAVNNWFTTYLDDNTQSMFYTHQGEVFIVLPEPEPGL